MGRLPSWHQSDDFLAAAALEAGIPCWPPPLSIHLVSLPSLPALPHPACLASLDPLSSCLSSRQFQGCPAQLVYPSGGLKGCFNPNYALTTVTTDTKTNVLGVRGRGGSDRLVPGGLIKGDPLGPEAMSTAPSEGALGIRGSGVIGLLS